LIFAGSSELVGEIVLAVCPVGVGQLFPPRGHDTEVGELAIRAL